ncbi:MAG: hypothetical protein GX596_07290 [Propionibacterium sp.]|nr:hypothetical protein [Propionibacterium sp.]
MATWQDGAAYAPVERPDGFATPIAEPLSEADQRERVTPGAIAPPSRLDLPGDAIALERIGGGRGAHPGRNPGEPFDVASAAITTVPATDDGKRDPRAPFAVTTPERAVEPSQPPPPPPDQQPLPEAAVPSTRPSAATSGLQPGQKPLVLLVAGLCTVGVILTSAAPLLLVVAGLIAVLRVPWVSKIGAIALGVGSTFFLVQLLFPATRPGVLFGLTSLLLAAAFLIRAFAVKGDDAEPV